MTQRKERRARVVVTGAGVVAPGAVGRHAFWTRMAEGRSMVREDLEMLALGLDSRPFSARVAESDLAGLDSDDACRRPTRLQRLGIAAGDMALRDAGREPAAPGGSREGVVFSSAVSGSPSIQEMYETMTAGGREAPCWHPLDVDWFDRATVHTVTAHLAHAYGMRGTVTSLTTGCTAGLDALGIGFDMVRHGEADRMLVGGTEAPISGLTVAMLHAIGALATAETPPEHASRPFDARRSGFVIGEGAAALVLESLEAAQARGVPVLGEVRGFASVCSAYHMTDLPSDGSVMATAIRLALADGEVEADELDYINAHGTSTQQNDAFEATALKLALGDAARRIPVGSTKAVMGHSFSAAPLLGCMTALGAIAQSLVPPTANLDTPDPEFDLDLVRGCARPRQVAKAMVMASGFGGIHSVAILGRLSS
jgi:3-oxoacyl-(acyl-carrier-protein) synthase